MFLSDLADGSSIFIDANVFVYHFSRQSRFNSSCSAFLERIYFAGYKKELDSMWKVRMRFKRVDAQYLGRYAHFFIPFPAIFTLFQGIEKRFFPPSAKHCFVASVVAKK